LDDFARHMAFGASNACGEAGSGSNRVMDLYRCFAAITVAVCVAMHGALAQPSQAYHRNIPYDPSKCSRDAHNTSAPER